MVTQMQGDAKLKVIDDINNLVKIIGLNLNMYFKYMFLETHFEIYTPLFLL